MFGLENLQSAVKGFVLCAVTFSIQGLEANAVVQIHGSNDAFSLKSPRRLLFSRSDDNPTYQSSSAKDAGEIAYIVIYAILLILVGICKCCSKSGCTIEDDSSEGREHDRVPPRRVFTMSSYANMPPTFVATWHQENQSSTIYTSGSRIPSPRTIDTSSSTQRASRGTAVNPQVVLRPPRSSSSVILMPDAEPVPLTYLGIENPVYNLRTNALINSDPSLNQTLDPTPTTFVDIPPAYNTVVNNENYPKVSESPPPQY